jgi:hypothetical protein
MRWGWCEGLDLEEQAQDFEDDTAAEDEAEDYCGIRQPFDSYHLRRSLFIPRLSWFLVESTQSAN